MADLSWFPYDADQWERRVRELGLSLLEEGALMRLLRHAWRAESHPCTILDRPDELARIIGHEARKAVPVLRAHFTPLPDEPGRLRCEWLYDLYLRQLEKHQSYQARGRKGGWTGSEPPRQVNARPGVAFADPAQRAPRISLPAWRRAALVLRDGNACVWCEARENLHLDHIIPLSVGGTNDDDNYQALCRSCNQFKKGADPREAVDG